MICIYCITNKINNKQYVGKTTNGIWRRWKEHISDSKRKRKENRPLYKAFLKYGISNFKIEILEECSFEILSKREVYWINRLQTYKYGYNATKGGDGSQLYDYYKIISLYKELKYISKVAEKVQCSIDTVRKCLKLYNIPKYRHISENVNPPKRIQQYSLNGDLLSEFDSVQKAAEWLYVNKKVKTLVSGVRGHISDAARGKIKSAYKYIWKYI